MTKNFTTVAMRLDRGQRKFLKDNITLSNGEKKQYLMVNIRVRNLFDRPVTIEWNEKPTKEKTYADGVDYFTKQLRLINHFEAACGGASKQ